MAEKITTTPALMTHVMSVGLPSPADSATFVFVRRLLLAADGWVPARSLDGLERRLVALDVREDGGGGGGRVELGFGRCSRVC